MSQILDGLDGMLCLIHDVLIYWKDQQEHDASLEAALNRIKMAGGTWNRAKREFSKTKVCFWAM